LLHEEAAAEEIDGGGRGLPGETGEKLLDAAPLAQIDQEVADFPELIGGQFGVGGEGQCDRQCLFAAAGVQFEAGDGAGKAGVLREAGGTAVEMLPGPTGLIPRPIDPRCQQ
jgi:hypothetical protein